MYVSIWIAVFIEKGAFGHLRGVSMGAAPPSSRWISNRHPTPGTSSVPAFPYRVWK